MREFCQSCLHKSSPLLLPSFFSVHKTCVSNTFFLFFFFFFLRYKAIGIRLSASARTSSVTKPHGDFDSLKGEQDYSALGVAVKLERVRWSRGERGGDGGGMNAMHVWEVVLAGFEINDLNMCYS